MKTFLMKEALKLKSWIKNIVKTCNDNTSMWLGALKVVSNLQENIVYLNTKYTYMISMKYESMLWFLAIFVNILIEI